MNNYTEFTSQCKNSTIGGNSSITETFDVSFWIDGVLISIIAAIGFILNNISLFILVSKKNLQNVFNHLLVFSFIAQNLYIFSSAFPRFYYNLKINLVVYFMPYFAHPLKEISLTLNILIPLCLSHERYIVIPDPREYKKYMDVKRNRQRRLFLYIIPVLTFSILYNIPKFFSYNLIFNECKKLTEHKKSDLRRSYEFITYYLGISWAIIIIIVFMMLCFFNWKIIRNIGSNFKHTEDQLSFRITMVKGRKFSTADLPKVPVKCSKKPKLQKHEKLSLASVALVFVFFVCNLPRITEEVMDVFHVDIYALEVISRFLLTLNSSINIFIYCSLNEKFNAHFKTMILCFSSSTRGEKKKQDQNKYSRTMSDGSYTTNSEKML